MSHYREHLATVSETTGDANPTNQVRNFSLSELVSASEVSARISDIPVVNVRVRVSSEGDAGPETKNHAEAEKFDDYVGCERNGGGSRDLGHGFEVGDMVWGKVKSHPWWPGHIYDEVFASPTVLRTKRERHVLVAFFGDSSYGWFEPGELIPFDANFAEKSRQTNSRTFLKAVEEAVDEASRRCALGLLCRCRNPYDFCPTNVQGYFSVNVPDYEPGVYSDAQIRKARNDFGPIQTLAFIKQLALAPHVGDYRSNDFVKNKATVVALRRAVFEPNDETYAQALGVQPFRPSDPEFNPLDQPVTHPNSAPLSGPLVMAETFGSEKNATKSVKVGGNFKKDRYLLKRREEASNSLQLASREEALDAAERHVFQKRPLVVSVAPQVLEKHGDNFSQDGGAIKAKIIIEDQVQPDGTGLASQEIILDAKPHLLDKIKESSEEMIKSFEPDDVSKSMGRPDFSGEMALPRIVDKTFQSTSQESKTYIDVKHDGNVVPSGPHEDYQRTEQECLTITDEVKHRKLGVDGVLKKIKVHRRPADDLNSETSAIGEKKKKKKINSLNLQPTPGHLEKSSISEKYVQLSERLIGKPVSIGLASGEDLHAEPMQVDVSASNLLPADNIAKVNFELPQLLDELQALALDPFHGVKRGIPTIVRKFFLRFRSLVYQKSLLMSPSTKNEAPEVCATKSPSSFVASDSHDDHAIASPLVKPVKHIVQPDDPTKVGWKRAISDCQEEINAKRLKKINYLKTLAAEKKVASQKTSEAWQVEEKDSVIQAPPKKVKPDSIRRMERPTKPVEPTMLVIKFPAKTSLPSLAELKARFARFGAIDQSGLRVFWKTSTCRVVFLHKVDAQAAYKFSRANQSLFCSAGVRCFLHELRDSSSDVSEAAKARGADGACVMPQIKDPVVAQHQTSVSAQQLLPQPTIQLKSILKKSTGDELGQGTGNGGNSKGTPRVKFMLGGEETNRGEQLLMGNRNNFNNASFADGSAPSPVAMDLNRKNVQNVISQPSLPNLISPTQFAKIPQHNLHNSEMAPMNSPSFINTTASVTSTTVDISQRMIILLTRCNDIVTNMTGLLGYVPYHPL